MSTDEDVLEFGFGLTEILFPHKLNDRVNDEIGKSIEDFVNVNLNGIGLYFLSGPVLKKLELWADGSPSYIHKSTRKLNQSEERLRSAIERAISGISEQSSPLIAYSSQIPSKEQRQAFIIARYLRNLIEFCSKDEFDALRSQIFDKPSDFEESVAAFINHYDNCSEHNPTTHSKVNLHDFKIIKKGIEKIFEFWIGRNKSQLAEIENKNSEYFWLHGHFESLIATHEPIEFVRNYDFSGPIDAIREVVDPFAFNRDKGDRSRHEYIRLYLVKSPIITSYNQPKYGSAEEKRVCYLVNNLKDGYGELTAKLLEKGLIKWADEWNGQVTRKQLESGKPVVLILRKGKWSLDAKHGDKEYDLGGLVSNGRFRVCEYDRKGEIEEILEGKKPDYNYENALKNLLYRKALYALNDTHRNMSGEIVFFMRPAYSTLREFGK